MKTFGTIIPLIGGMTLGNMRALRTKPSWIVGYAPFANNEESLENYLPDVPFYETEIGGDLSGLPRVDVVSTVCPCAGLSMLNCASGSEKSRGCNALQNNWLYITARAILPSLRPKVIIGENSPGLFTSKGEEVRWRLFDIASEFGYSLSFVKTDTFLHGIPQHRVRTFYFFWDSTTAPILNYYDIKPPTLTEYLSRIPVIATQQEQIEPELAEHASFKYVKHKLGDSWRSVLLNNGRSVYSWVIANNLIDDFIDFCKSLTDKTAVKMVRRMTEIREKLLDGLGYWNDSIIFYGEEINAVITKNVVTAIHPTEDRSFTYRELLWMMGMPNDFELVGGLKRRMGTIFQNVPVNTAACWTHEAELFIDGLLKNSGTPFLMQDNTKKLITAKDL